MTENTFLSFNILSSVVDNNRYKKCAINNCENDGDYFLCCSTINKLGLFCKKCRIELEDSRIIDYTSSDYSVIAGANRK